MLHVHEICADPYITSACKTPVPMFYTSVSFFVVFIVIAALVLLTLFVGVVTTSMEEASKQQEIEQEMESKILEICDGHEVTHEQLTIY